MARERTTYEERASGLLLGGRGGDVRLAQRQRHAEMSLLRVEQQTAPPTTNVSHRTQRTAKRVEANGMLTLALARRHACNPRRRR
jgi:hypothetical protein